MFVEWSSTKNIIFVQTRLVFGCHGNKKAKFAKKIKSLEAIRVIKVKLFIALASLGKMKIGFNCCFIAGILTELFGNVS